jgi:hypothetical protein
MQSTIQTKTFVRAATLMVALAAAGCGDRDSILSPSPEVPSPLVPAPTFTISGVIVESTESGSVALEGVIVENAFTHEVAVTDSEGMYSMRGINAGLAQLSISKEGFATQLVDTMVDGDERIDVTLVRE